MQLTVLQLKFTNYPLLPFPSDAIDSATVDPQETQTRAACICPKFLCACSISLASRVRRGYTTCVPALAIYKVLLVHSGKTRLASH